MSPVSRLLKKSTQDLLDRLTWLEGRAKKADERIGSWMNTRATIEEQVADVNLALRERGIVPTKGVRLDGEKEQSYQ